MTRFSGLAEHRAAKALGATAHQHDCGHWCFCNLFPHHSPDCLRCRRAAFTKYRRELVG